MCIHSKMTVQCKTQIFHLTSLLLKPWSTMIERGDTALPAVVPSEPSEAVKEYEEQTMRTKCSL